MVFCIFCVNVFISSFHYFFQTGTPLYYEHLHIEISTQRTLIGHNDDNYDDDELFLLSGLIRTPI